MAKRTSRTNKQIITLESAVTGNIDALTFSNAPNQNPVIRWEDTTGDGGLKFAIGGTVIASLGDTGYWVGTGFSTNTIYMSADSLFRSNSQRIRLDALGNPAITMSDELAQSGYTGIVQVKGGHASVPIFQVRGAVGQAGNYLEFRDSASALQSFMTIVSGNLQMGTATSAVLSPSILIETGAATSTGTSGSAVIKSGNKTSGASGGSGDASLLSGNVATGSGSSGIVRAISGSTVDGNSGGVQVTTGSVSGVAAGSSGTIDLTTGNAVFGNSGNINFTIGTDGAGGSRGRIKFVDGTEGTAGHVWTSTDTLGNGAWAAAAGGGANTALSNLASVAFNVDLLPASNGGQGIGSNAKRLGAFHLQNMANIYAQNGVRFYDLDSSDSVTLISHATATSHTLTLPPAQAAGALTNDGSGNLSWTATSGANTTLSNLINTIAIPDGVHLTPLNTLQVNLGSASKKYSEGYINTLYSPNILNAASGNTPLVIDTIASTATAPVSIRTGAASAGNSGGINLITGTATGTQGEFRFIKNGTTTTIGHVWTASATDGTGYWAAGGGGGANTALSNLAAVAVNTAILPAVTATTALGSASFVWSSVFTNVVTGTTASGLTLSSPNVTSGTSGLVYIATGTNSVSGNSGQIVIETGGATSGSSSAVTIRTGTGSSGSGQINLTTGSAGARGRVVVDAAALEVQATILPNTGNTYAVGTSLARYNNMYSEAFSLSDNGGLIDGRIERAQTTPSGASTGFVVRAGENSSTVRNLGLITANQSSSSTPTGSIYIETGNKSGGADNSGAIRLTTGTAPSGQDSGLIALTTSNATGAGGDSGNITFTTGTSAAGTRGAIALDSSTVTVASNFTPSTNNTRTCGSNSLAWVGVYTQQVISSQALNMDAAGGSDVNVNTSTSTTGGNANVFAGGSTGNAQVGGSVLIRSGGQFNVTAGNSGSVSLVSGNSTAGASGNILLTTGTAGTTRGEVVIDASETKVTGGLTVGSTGNSISTILTGTFSVTVPAIIAGDMSTTVTGTVTGLVDGDHVTVTPPNAAFEDGMVFSCYVSAGDTLAINIGNMSGVTFTGSTQNWRYLVHKA